MPHVERRPDFQQVINGNSAWGTESPVKIESERIGTGKPLQTGLLISWKLIRRSVSGNRDQQNSQWNRVRSLRCYQLLQPAGIGASWENQGKHTAGIDGQTAYF